MSQDKTEYSRLLLKRSGIPGEVPTFTTGTTLNEMIPTDLFVGEMYLNTADDLMWVRTDNGILPIALSGMTGTTIPTLLEVLGTGNITGGFNIYVSSGTTIQYEGLNTGSTTTILGLDASGNTITTSVAGATQDLDNVLSYGNTTGPYDIIVSSGQTIQYQSLSNGSSNTILALDTTGGTITTTITDGNTYITGGTITYTGSNGTLDLFDTSGNTISITGLTDIYTTGGTYSSSDGELSLTRNDGTTYTINGFFTGYTNLVETLTAGTGLSGDTTTGNVTIVNTIRNGSFGITIDGGGSAITTGVKGYITIPYDCTITGWDILADVSGSIVVDVWKDTYANFPPTVADTIAGSEKPTLSSQVKNQDNSLSTWTTSVSSGDIIGFNVDSASTLTRVNLTIKVLKTS